MSDELQGQVDEGRTPPAEQYEIQFKNGALANLKELAKSFSVPETELRKVIEKSVNLLTLVKDAKSLVLEDKNGNRYIVDLRRL